MKTIIRSYYSDCEEADDGIYEVEIPADVEDYKKVISETYAEMNKNGEWDEYEGSTLSSLLDRLNWKWHYLEFTDFNAVCGTFL